jgi:hypothetical protein
MGFDWELHFRQSDPIAAINYTARSTAVPQHLSRDLWYRLRALTSPSHRTPRWLIGRGGVGPHELNGRRNNAAVGKAGNAETPEILGGFCWFQ